MDYTEGSFDGAHRPYAGEPRPPSYDKLINDTET
jgi:hypothetical protein